MGQVGKLLAHGCYFCNKVVDEMVLFVYSFVCLIWATALGVHLQLLFSNFVGQWTEQDPYYHPSKVHIPLKQTRSRVLK